MCNKELDAKVEQLIDEVNLLKKLVLTLVNQRNPIIIAQQPSYNPPVHISTEVEVARCNCPAVSAPHQRGPGCLDTWLTC